MWTGDGFSCTAAMQKSKNNNNTTTTPKRMMLHYCGDGDTGAVCTEDDLFPSSRDRFRSLPDMSRLCNQSLHEYVGKSSSTTVAQNIPKETLIPTTTKQQFLSKSKPQHQVPQQHVVVNNDEQQQFTTEHATFIIACRHGDQTTLQKLCSDARQSGGVGGKQHKAYATLLKDQLDDLFIELAVHGTVEVLEWILDEFRFGGRDVRGQGDHTFALLCAHAPLGTAQWFAKRYRLVASDIMKSDALEMAAVRSRADVVQWLADILRPAGYSCDRLNAWISVSGLMVGRQTHTGMTNALVDLS